MRLTMKLIFGVVVSDPMALIQVRSGARRQLVRRSIDDDDDVTPARRSLLLRSPWVRCLRCRWSSRTSTSSSLTARRHSRLGVKKHVELYVYHRFARSHLTQLDHPLMTKTLMNFARSFWCTLQ
uniref:Uncharacterized protein n=1 Tax=Oryza barthii TaxID=65489 RepID=A0A0D3H679_9ORYZ